MRSVISPGAGGAKVIVGQLKATSGTLAEMATDALTLSANDEGKRWQATDDNDRIYVWSFAGGVWGYYPESGADADGNIKVTPQNVATPPQLRRYQEDITIAQLTSDNTGAKLSIDVSGYKTALMVVDKAGVSNGDTVSCTAYLDDGQTIETHAIGWSALSHNGSEGSRVVLQAITLGTFYVDLKGIKFLRLWKAIGGATADVVLNMVYTG